MNKYIFISSFIGFISLFSYGAQLSAETPSNEQLSQAQQLATEGQFSAARSILNRLISQHPAAPEPYNNLAALEAQQGNIEAAQSLLEKALRTNPSYQLSFQNLTALNQRIALQAYNKSLALKPPQSSLSLNTTDQFSSTAASPIKIVEKPVEVIKEVVKEVVREVERIVEVPADCPIISPASNKDCDTETTYPDPTDTVQEWAKAWSAKDIAKYISLYTRNYSHAPNKSHVDWVTLRRQRLATPKYIRVSAQNIRVNRLANEAASVDFLQNYQSDTINDSIRKILLLVIEDGQWKIQQELVLR